LNVATRHGSLGDVAHAVFLSGHGPLVAVLQADWGTHLAVI
jgi:hypothetical protein